MTMSNFNYERRFRLWRRRQAAERAAGWAGCPGGSAGSPSVHPLAAERGSISSGIREGKGTKAENNSYCFP